MSQKRAEAESSNCEQTTEAVSQQQDIDAKRAKLVSLSDTTLQDLPIELLECILVKVVAMEVKGMKLAKSVWKERADLVIDRLRNVCSQWSSICETNFFRNEIHRTLDSTAQETIRWEMLSQFPIQFPFIDMTALKDEIFILYKPLGEDYVIKVFDRNNMGEVKDVIPLPGICPQNIKACNVSNCVYVLNAELNQSTKAKGDSVLRITKAEDQLFKMSPWITDLQLPLLNISVSSDGSLVTLSRWRVPTPPFTIVNIYHAANGFFQRQLVLFPHVLGLESVENVIQKSDGNLILISDDSLSKTELMEIDRFGSSVRRYQTALNGQISVNSADNYGRILITSGHGTYELLDSELNRLDFTGLKPHEGHYEVTSNLHINSERNEIMRVYHSFFPSIYVLTIFRLI